jgi:hypothetical protein
MCSFCLLHGKEEICYAQGTEKKLICQKPEYKREHIEWLYEVLGLKKSLVIILLKSRSSQVVNQAEEAWMEMEAAEDAEIFFVNAVQGMQGRTPRRSGTQKTEDPCDCPRLEEEYTLS